MPFTENNEAASHIGKAEAGKRIAFGSYKGAPIEWRVLDIEDGRALLVSKYLLDKRPYNETWTDVTWETCDLRKWLNADFYKAAFNDTEKAGIVETDIVNENNPDYKTKGGNDTRDRVFLLSIGQVGRYLPSDTDRMGKYVSGDRGWWWLRSPGYYTILAAYVLTNGVAAYGRSVDSGFGLRPALWLNL